MPIVNLTRKTWLATKTSKANKFFTRLVGLLRRRSLGPEEALWIVPGKGVHTFGMKFPIDVVFLNKRGKVVHLVPSLAPMSMSKVCLNAYSILELPNGTIEKSCTEIGDELDISSEERLEVGALRESRLHQVEHQ